MSDSLRPPVHGILQAKILEWVAISSSKWNFIPLQKKKKKKKNPLFSLVELDYQK